MPPKAFKSGLQANSGMMRIYLDANVFIAYIKSDMGKPFKLMYKKRAKRINGLKANPFP
ncbi:MAG: hypothetical protein HYW05_04620 [Candidatus Diapherotrites archaeon]|nr:hypothetical protein [Candidatus Diapherotrites archaeon]